MNTRTQVSVAHSTAGDWATDEAFFEIAGEIDVTDFVDLEAADPRVSAGQSDGFIAEKRSVNTCGICCTMTACTEYCSMCP
jgi:hypothetical protein